MRLDKEAIIEAKRELGIVLPVQIRVREQSNFGRYKRIAGNHRIVDGPKHLIMLYLREHTDAESLSETLWHELAHAAQCEEFVRQTGESPEEFYDLYMKNAGGLGAEYLNNGLEVAARRIAHHKVHVLHHMLAIGPEK